MTRFRVTYECPNSQCGYRDTLEIEAPSEAAAWQTSSVPCPAHELSGDMRPVRVEEVETT